MVIRRPISPLQYLRFPREPIGLSGVPFHALMGWGVGDPYILVSLAEVVLAVDVMTRQELLVYGQVVLFPTEFGRLPAVVRVLAVELDLGTPEVDAIAALVAIIKGDHDLAWEIA